MKELIKELSALCGASGYEHFINEKIKSIFEPCSDETYIDISGNVIAVKKCGKSNAARVIIEAHMDEIGLMVSGIDDNGFLSVVSIGGIDPRILASDEVTVHGKRKILGVIGAKPPHLISRNEEKKAYKLSNLAVDTGLAAEEVKELVKIGDFVTMNSPCFELLNGQMAGKALDDRACVAILADVFEKINTEKLSADIYAVVSTKEEVGGFGAQTAAFSINPDLAIAIDVCHAVTPDNSYCAYEIGGGAVVTVGPNIHPAISERLKISAKENDLKIQIDADGGDTGTDAWVMQTVREGIPTGLISLPLKYMHTTREVISLSDAECVSALMRGFLENLGDTEEWLCL